MNHVDCLSRDFANSVKKSPELSILSWPESEKSWKVSFFISDQGTAFTSEHFASFCKSNDIKHSLIAAKTPRANGQVERIFHFVTEALRSYCSEESPTKWEEFLPSVQWALNSLKNNTIGESPQRMLLGFEPKNVLGNHLLNALLDARPVLTDWDKEREEIRNQAFTRMEKKRSERAERHNRNHRKPRNYKVGDLVLLRYEMAPTGSSRKLGPRFRGPYVVAAVQGADRYRITDTGSTQVTSRKFDKVYAAEDMRYWGVPPDDEFSDSDTE
ncbi:hypothetical protein DMENIID0001_122480 [Sergentomyia squamirostris]